MSNQITVFKTNGEILGYVDHGLRCFAYVSGIYKKYYGTAIAEALSNPDKINELLSNFYNREKISAHEKLAVMVFMNDRSYYREKDVKLFTEAIDNFPKEWADGPKVLLQLYLKALQENKEIITQCNNDIFETDLEKYTDTELFWELRDRNVVKSILKIT
jgi:hypothetical protein